MKKILENHLDKYPLMEAIDILKLLYQSEFGGGHMIANENQSLVRIKKEYEEMKNCIPSTAVVCEPIGDNICRIYLNALTEGLLPETLNKMFVNSANEKHGSVEGLEEKISILIDFLKQSSLSTIISTNNRCSLYDTIEKWKSTGYPIISHSQTYRDNYYPAYRVVDINYAKYYSVFLEIDRFLSSDSFGNNNPNKPLLISIDGMCGSGKTTLSKLLESIYDCNVFHMDDFFLQPHQRTEKRLNEVGGNVDYERFFDEVLSHINDKNGLSYRIYDCQTGQLGKTITVPYKQINIIEGVYSNHPYFKDAYDIRFFLEIPETLQKERIIKRNGKEFANRFFTEWIPKENAYFNAFSVKDKCTLIAFEK